MEKEKKEFEERVIEVSRVSRTVKGGRRLRFRALVAIGNRQGKVGIGIGKANEVVIAVTKAVNQARKNLIAVPIVNDSIPHEVKLKYGSAVVFLKPALPGTSIIAGSSVRPVIELAGIKNILSKIFGSSNKINNVQATIEALRTLRVKEKREESSEQRVVSGEEKSDERGERREARKKQEEGSKKETNKKGKDAPANKTRT